MSELEEVFKEWWETFIELANVFGSHDDGLKKSLSKRADSLMELEREFRGKVALPRLRPAAQCVGRRIQPYGAAQRASNALERLRALRVSASGVSGLRGHRTPAEYDFAARLNLRWHKLRDLEKQLVAVNMARYEMERTVPSVYYLHVLGEMKDIRPRVGSEQALAIISLHRAGVPSAYVAGVVTPSRLNPDSAVSVLSMYTEGIPSELAKEVL